MARSSFRSESRISEVEGFHLAVASAIDAWGSIEARLQETFALCLSIGPARDAQSSGPSPWIASILGAAEAFSIKLNLVDAAMKAAFLGFVEAPEIETEWVAIRRKAAELAPIRNALACSTVVQERDADGHIEQLTLRPRHQFGRDVQACTLADVRTWERRFLAFTHRLNLLNERLSGNAGLRRRHIIRFAEQIIAAEGSCDLIDLLKAELAADGVA